MGKIYHYTSMQSFESIISHQCIRMTRSDFMNDPHDCQIFFDIVGNYVDDKKVDQIMNNSKLNYKNEVLEIIKSYPVLDYMRYIFTNVPMYVFSLTSESDSLPMWNYYSGEGLRVSFEEEEILDKISQTLCKKKFELLVKTKVEYINAFTRLADITLDSFSEFIVKEYCQSDKRVNGRKHSIIHHDGQNLEFFINSYVKSYLMTIDYLIDYYYTSGKSLKDIYLPKVDNKFFRRIFKENKEQKATKMQFKTDIDIYMLILATRYKPKTFENEKETRIVFFDYNLEDNEKECYCLSTNRFGTCLKPYICCEFESEGDNTMVSLILDVILSPMTSSMPFQLNTYKKVINDFIKKNGGNLTVEDISVSEHDIRW